MKWTTAGVLAGLGFAGVLAVIVPDWHRPWFAGTQTSYRGQSNVQFYSRAETQAINSFVPPVLPAAADGGPKATDVYKNVKVLTDVNAAEFMRLQQALTNWVSPGQGCAFCHNTGNWASDEKRTKLIARRMLEMTRYVNSAWGGHVNPTGVTCYTCHRGQPVPAEVWWPRIEREQKPFIDRAEQWKETAPTVSTFFPNAGYAEYYLQDHPVAVISTSALRTNDVGSYIAATRIYEMMMQMSLQIGVNCGYCHASRAFQDWNQSTPMRWVGYYSLRLIRDLNRNYLLPLAQVIPQQRELVHPTPVPVVPAYEKGQQPGNALLTCETCHYRLPNPMNGVNMVKDYPGLVGHDGPAKDDDPSGSSAANEARMQAALARIGPGDPDPNGKPVGAAE